jgi:hypothetical protein
MLLNKRKLGDKDTSQKFGSLYMEVDINKEVNLYFIAIFLIRRFVYAVTIVYIENTTY